VPVSRWNCRRRPTATTVLHLQRRRIALDVRDGRIIWSS
jgi:hypothetical protein